MPKTILFDQEARSAIRNGVCQLAKAVKITLGPKGRNVLLQKDFGSPVVTKDGVTVAKAISLEDPYENMGAQMVKEVASKTNDITGDGTTTATVLAEAIFVEGMKAVISGVNPIQLKSGIEKAIVDICLELDKMSIKVSSKEDITNIAAIAANNDLDVGELLSYAIDKVGKDGVITIEESQTRETTVDLVEGMQFDRGYISPHMITDPTSLETVFDNCLILMIESKVTGIKDLIPILEKVTEVEKPLLIIAEDVGGDALAAIVINHMRGVIKCCAVKSPGFGDRRNQTLQDIAAVVGGVAVMDTLGTKLSEMTIDQLGSAKKIIVTKNSTVVVQGGGSSEAVEARTNEIRREIDQSVSDFDREKLEERLAKLVGGVAKVNVGAVTESEMKAKKSRIEDALHATRAAADSGILPGGGVALIRAAGLIEPDSNIHPDQMLGYQIVVRACSSPLRSIASNAGQDGGIVCEKVKEMKGNMGYNALRGVYEDLVVAGIIDPAKVTKTAISNAASVSTLLLTSDALIVEKQAE